MSPRVIPIHPLEASCNIYPQQYSGLIYYVVQVMSGLTRSPTPALRLALLN